MILNGNLFDLADEPREVRELDEAAAGWAVLAQRRQFDEFGGQPHVGFEWCWLFDSADYSRVGA